MLNSATAGITKLSPKTNPLQCNYLYVRRAGLGHVRIPLHSQSADGSVPVRQLPAAQLDRREPSGRVRPDARRIKLTLLGANLFHSASAASSAPWTTANPPSDVVCGYVPAGGYAQQHALSVELLQRYRHQRLCKANGARRRSAELHCRARSTTARSVARRRRSTSTSTRR